jgi:hypothetical protein
MADDDLLRDAKDLFDQAQSAEDHNRTTYEEDIRFSREEIQWPDDIVADRQRDGRPCLTINKLNAFIRQVVNDSRQNKPAIKVHPADSNADVATADVINGIIRNIEYTSNADVAYDTAIESAVSGGFGYWRVGLDYAYHDSFEMDLSIMRVANPLSVYGDPNSTAADSSDWNDAFVVERLTRDEFTAKYGKKSSADWDEMGAWGNEPWREADEVMVAEWWHRDEVEQKIVLASNGQVYAAADIETSDDLKALFAQGLLQVKRERLALTHKVVQRTMSGAEILDEQNWLGCYIPLVPVYGDEFNIKGKRYFRSLIHSAIDAQRMFNYWRTNATELVALAPRVPFIGPQGAFDNDPNWQTANRVSHPYLEYKGQVPPQRQPLDLGAAAGSLQEALNAADDMKAIMGLYDASLGARSNETSGVAITARQREGDVSTFHFIDNLARAIRHTGRILIDLIPHVYNEQRIVRILGEDGTPQSKPINQQYPVRDPKTGQPVMQPVPGPNGQPIMQPIMAMHDITVGKYDLTVTTGPSFTTRREEAAYQMTEMMRAFPASAPIIGPELAKNLDWPGADTIAEKLDRATQPQVPPEMQQAIQKGQELIQKLHQENAKLKASQNAAMAKVQQAEMEGRRRAELDAADQQRQALSDQLDREIAGYQAETARIAALANVHRAMNPPQITRADAPQQ